MIETAASPQVDQRGTWGAEIRAVYLKELRGELRSKSGIAISGLFGAFSVIAIAFATAGVKLNATTAAALFWIVLLFTSMIALPRTFTIEEELGTGDLLRLVARPHSVFWGKMLFNLTQLLIASVLLATLFFLLARVEVVSLGLLLISLVGSCLTLAGGVTLCGALVAQASNRNALAAVISMPLLLPLTVVGIAALRVAFGEVGATTGMRNALGLICYGVLSVTVGPYLYAQVWKE